MKLAIKKATTDVSVYVFIQNSSLTTGAGLTGLAYNSASLTAYYVRPLASAAAITLATQTVTGAHSDGGFVEVDATNMPGVYRFDLPDAVCATGVNSVVVMLKGATNMAPVLLEIQLVSYDPNDTVRLGLTALPNAAADAAGGLPISDAGGLDLDTLIGRLDAAVTTRLAPTTAGRTLDVTAGGCAGIDWANVEAPTTAVNLSATNIDTDQVVASVTGAVGSVTGNVGGNVVGSVASVTAGVTLAASAVQAIWDALTSALTTVGSIGKLLVDNINATISSRLASASYTAPLDAAGTRAAVGLASANLDTQLDALPTAAENADAVWDEVLTGATHNVSLSAGRRLRQLDSISAHSGTAQAGASNSITLDTGASATNEIYDGNLIVITGGTGAGQARVIVEYNGTTKVASVDEVWVTNPDVTSEFQIVAGAQVGITQHGLAQAGGASTITLSSTASSQNDIYVGQVVLIRTSTGSGQSRLITAYDGTTKVATVSPAWSIQPTSSSVYAILPGGSAIVESLSTAANAAIADAVWDEDATAHQTQGTFGQAIGDPGTDADSIWALANTNLDAAVSSRLSTAGYTAPLDAAGVRTAVGLASANLDTQLGDLPTATENADALLDRSAGVETNRTPRQALRLMLAAMAGKLSGAATTTVVIRDTNDTVDRITATVDESGNRTAVTLDAS